MAYMTLLNNEHKSKIMDKAGRKYSTLFRYALSSKLAMTFTAKDCPRRVHVPHCSEVMHFDRLGISFQGLKKPFS